MMWFLNILLDITNYLWQSTFFTNLGLSNNIVQADVDRKEDWFEKALRVAEYKAKVKITRDEHQGRISVNYQQTTFVIENEDYEALRREWRDKFLRTGQVVVNPNTLWSISDEGREKKQHQDILDKKERLKQTIAADKQNYADTLGRLQLQLSKSAQALQKIKENAINQELVGSKFDIKYWLSRLNNYSQIIQSFEQHFEIMHTYQAEEFWHNMPEITTSNTLGRVEATLIDHKQQLHSKKVGIVTRIINPNNQILESLDRALTAILSNQEKALRANDLESSRHRDIKIHVVISDLNSDDITKQHNIDQLNLERLFKTESSLARTFTGAIRNSAYSLTRSSITPLSY